MVWLQDGHSSIFSLFFLIQFGSHYFLSPVLLSSGLVVGDGGESSFCKDTTCCVLLGHFILLLMGIKICYSFCCVFCFVCVFRGDSLVLQEIGFTGCR